MFLEQPRGIVAKECLEIAQLSGSGSIHSEFEDAPFWLRPHHSCFAQPDTTDKGRRDANCRNNFDGHIPLHFVKYGIDYKLNSGILSSEGYSIRKERAT